MRSLPRMRVCRQTWCSLWENRYRWLHVWRSGTVLNDESVSEEPNLVSFLKDMRPVIMSSLRDTEINTGVEYRVNCSAAGRPAPLHGEISLVKADKSTLYVSPITLFATMNRWVIQRLTCSDFWLSSGCGHKDEEWSDNIHVQGGKDVAVWCRSLVMSCENQKFSWGERIPGKRQRWDCVSHLSSCNWFLLSILCNQVYLLINLKPNIWFQFHPNHTTLPSWTAAVRITCLFS